MKKIIFFFLLITELTSCGHDLKCADFKNGKFKVPADSIFPYEGTLIRKNGKQIEWSTKNSDTNHIDIQYIDDCNYILTYNSELNELDELDQLINDSGGMKVEVLEIKGDTLFYNGLISNDTLRYEQPGLIIKLE